MKSIIFNKRIVFATVTIICVIISSTIVDGVPKLKKTNQRIKRRPTVNGNAASRINHIFPRPSGKQNIAPEKKQKPNGSFNPVSFLNKKHENDPVRASQTILPLLH